MQKPVVWDREEDSGKEDQFDKDLEAQTQKRLDEIRAEAEAKMDQILEEQREKNRLYN